MQPLQIRPYNPVVLFIMTNIQIFQNIPLSAGFSDAAQVKIVVAFLHKKPPLTPKMVSGGLIWNAELLFMKFLICTLFQNDLQYIYFSF